MDDTSNMVKHADHASDGRDTIGGGEHPYDESVEFNQRSEHNLFVASWSRSSKHSGNVTTQTEQASYPTAPDPSRMMTTNVTGCYQPIIIGDITADTVNIRTSTSLNVIARETAKNIDKWTEGMVMTNSTDNVLHKISQGKTWITITGSPGEGKTTAGYLALKHLHSMGRHVFDIKTPVDYFKTKESKPVLMLNDIFGSFRFDTQQINKWEAVLSDILGMKEHKRDEESCDKNNPQLTIILISRASVLEEASHHLGRFRDLVLNNDSIVDFTHVSYFVGDVEEERLKIWRSHSKAFSFEIPEKLIREVCQMSIPHGFPHCCRLFATMYSKNKNLNMKSFFSKPLEFLNQTMESLMMGVVTGRLLRDMLRLDGSLHVNRISDDEMRFQYISVINSLKGTYLSSDNGTVTFHHPSIYDSAAFTVCTKDPLFVIKYCSLSFLNERVNFSGLQRGDQKETPDNIVIINSEYVPLFIDRLKLELVENKVSLTLSHPSFHDESFVDQFMKCILPSKDTEPISNSIKQFIHMKDSQSMETFLFLMTKSKSDKLLKYVCAFVELTENEQTETLFGICEHASPAAMQYFMGRFKDINVNMKNLNSETPLLISSRKCSEKVLQLLLERDVDIRTTDKKGNSSLHNICKYGLNENGDVVKILVGKGARVDVESWDFPFLPLHMACYEGHMNVVTALLECGANVNQRNRDGNTPLYFACIMRDKGILTLLLEKGADINGTDGSDYPYLHTACYDGHLDILTLLLDRKADIDIRDGGGKQALHAACFCGQLDLVELLVDRGANVNVTDSIHNTPLHDACYKGHTDVVAALLDRGAAINKANITGNTPLHRACDGGHVDVVNILLGKAADVNKANRDGYTPLHRAVSACHEDVIMVLVNNGADINKVITDGSTSLHRVCDDEDLDMLGYLLQMGADMNKPDSDGNTPLHRSCEKANVDCINLLTDKGADINLKNHEGNTAFLQASAAGNLVVMKCLLEKKVDINMSYKDGNTPLHRACSDGNINSTKLLLEEGADVNMINMNGKTPFECALMKRNEDVMTLLLEKGADIDKESIDGNTPLHTALLEKSLPLLSYLLAKGADVNKTNRKGDTPLSMIIDIYYRRQEHEAAVKLLLKNGADVNKTNLSGDTPLHRACRYDRMGLIQLLLACGADTTKKNSDGNTPLHSFLILCSEPCTDIASLLLDNGADINETDNKGNSVLHHTIQHSYEEVHVDFLKFFLSRGARVNAVNKIGNTPLIESCTKGHIDAVRVLIDNGANINKTGHCGTFPLDRACYWGHVEVVTLLLHKGADINQVNNAGKTSLHKACSNGHAEVVRVLLDGGVDVENDFPLHEACSRGHLSVVKVILEKGLDINKADPCGETPLCLACEKGKVDIVKVLLEKGADINRTDALGRTPLQRAMEDGHMNVVALLQEKRAHTH